MWEVEYNHDVANDGGFTEWWDVSDGGMTFRANTEQEAEWLMYTLRKR